jgi:2-keto-4-pentenoate hydratase
MGVPEAALSIAATRLRDAASSGIPCAPVRDLLEGGTIEDAYAVQQLNTDADVAAGRRVLGWKTGLTSEAVQRQLGVDQPDFGVVFADTCVGDDEPIAMGRLLQPRVEAEVAFVLEHDLDMHPVTSVDVVRATAFVLPAIEIVDSRVANWDITILDTVADNASSGLFVVGPRPTPLSAVDLWGARMQLRAGTTVVSEGVGAACLAHPVNAVVWLANTLSRIGRPLRAGELVLSGALGPMRPAEPNCTYEATIEQLGSVRACFRSDA